MRHLDRIDFIAPRPPGLPARRAPMLLGVACGLVAAALLQGSARGMVDVTTPLEAAVAREAVPVAGPSDAPRQSPTHGGRSAASRGRS